MSEWTNSHLQLMFSKDHVLACDTKKCMGIWQKLWGGKIATNFMGCWLLMSGLRLFKRCIFCSFQPSKPVTFCFISTYCVVLCFFFPESSLFYSLSALLKYPYYLCSWLIWMLDELYFPLLRVIFSLCFLEMNCFWKRIWTAGDYYPAFLVFVKAKKLTLYSEELWQYLGVTDFFLKWRWKNK